MYANVVFVIRCLYSALSLELENSALYELLIIIIICPSQLSEGVIDWLLRWTEDGL